jgi:hypothetical protein
MGIHHSQAKKAEKAGYTLEEQEDGMVRAFWPKRAVSLVGSSAGDAMTQMQAAQVLVEAGYRVKAVDTPRLVMILNDADMALAGSPMTPVEAHKTLIVDKQDGHWVDVSVQTDDVEKMGEEEEYPNASIPDTTAPAPIVERSPSGVALNGAIAYKEGTPAGDCPYSSEGSDETGEDEGNEEYDNFVRWNNEWDEAADEAAEEEDSKGGSVVAEKYRAKYAEMGHPTHCGDWLAEFLNEQVLSKEGTDLDRFEAICALNGVDTSKYRREGVGWQGRLRMTGRNLLAKKVYLAGGILLTPGINPEAGPDKHRAPAEWMATQRFKMPKADQAKPIPEAAE